MSIRPKNIGVAGAGGGRGVRRPMRPGHGGLNARLDRRSCALVPLFLLHYGQFMIPKIHLGWTKNVKVCTSFVIIARGTSNQVIESGRQCQIWCSLNKIHHSQRKHVRFYRVVMFAQASSDRHNTGRSPPTPISSCAKTAGSAAVSCDNHRIFTTLVNLSVSKASMCTRNPTCACTLCYT